MRLAVIPARGGSKRIPKKNIKDFCGRPMIAWSIEAAQSSGLFERIIVSTDDEEVAEVACQYGAEVPFIRPKELSDDYIGTTPVVAHAVEWAVEQGYEIDAVCCIYATAPLVQVDDLKRGLDVLNRGGWDYSFSVTNFSAPISRSFKQTNEGGIEMFFPNDFDTRSQDLSEALHDAGQFYWGLPSAWLKGKRVFDNHSAPVFIPRWRVQDIDTMDDWYRAELLRKLLLSSGEIN